MMRAVAEFVLDVKEGKKPRWLSLLGTTNAGKTYLAERVWNWYLRQPLHFAPQAAPLGFSDSGQWCYWPDVADELRANRGYGRLEELQYERFLVLDDIAAERDVSGHVAEKICTLLDRRLGKWTLITSNKSLEQIAELDRRIAGRIIREPNKFVQVNVPDYFTR